MGLHKTGTAIIVGTVKTSAPKSVETYEAKIVDNWR